MKAYKVPKESGPSLRASITIRYHTHDHPKTEIIDAPFFLSVGRRIFKEAMGKNTWKESEDELTDLMVQNAAGFLGRQRSYWQRRSSKGGSTTNDVAGRVNQRRESDDKFLLVTTGSGKLITRLHLTLDPGWGTTEMRTSREEARLRPFHPRPGGRSFVRSTNRG